MSFAPLPTRAERNAYERLESYSRDLEVRFKAVLDERDLLASRLNEVAENLADATAIIKTQSEMIGSLSQDRAKLREVELELADTKKALSAVSDGELVLVPRSPTDAMITRAINVSTASIPRVNFERERMRIRYRAMVNEFIRK